MSARRLPVRPDLDQLKHQAKDLLKAYRDGQAEAVALFAEFHPDRVGADRAKLRDAQLVLARIYGVSSWTRIVQCCQLIDAIWDDDRDVVRRLVTANRYLLTENAGIGNDNWGPPMSYAANLGRDRIIRLLYDLGARDLQLAMGLGPVIAAILVLRCEPVQALQLAAFALGLHAAMAFAHRPGWLSPELAPAWFWVGQLTYDLYIATLCSVCSRK